MDGRDILKTLGKKLEGMELLVNDKTNKESLSEMEGYKRAIEDIKDCLGYIRPATHPRRCNDCDDDIIITDIPSF